MAVRNTFYILVGLTISFSVISISYALSLEQASTIETDQNYSLKFTGQYFSDVTNEKFIVNTYETICKGYYTIENTDTSIIYTGYGDLAEQYTYVVEKPLSNEKASSTPPIDIVLTEPI